MNTVSGQWMVCVGLAVFFLLAPTRCSSTAPPHPASSSPPPPCPCLLRRPSPTCSPQPSHHFENLPPLPHSIEHFHRPHKKTSVLLSRASTASSQPPAPPSLHQDKAQVRHRPGRQSLDSNLFLHATQRLSPSPRGGWRPGTAAAAAAAALGSCEWQQQSGSHGLHQPPPLPAPTRL